MDSGLETALIFLVYTSIIFLVLIGIFLAKLLYDFSDLMKSVKDVVAVVNNEIEPTLAELKKALDSINSIATSTDKHVSALKDTVSKGFEIAYNATSKLKGLTVTALGGLLAGVKLLSSFKKKQ